MAKKAGVPAENTIFCTGSKYTCHYAAEPFWPPSEQRQPLRIVFNDNGLLFPSNAGKESRIVRFWTEGAAFNWLMRAKKK